MNTLYEIEEFESSDLTRNFKENMWIKTVLCWLFKKISLCINKPSIMSHFVLVIWIKTGFESPSRRGWFGQVCVIQIINVSLNGRLKKKNLSILTQISYCIQINLELALEAHFQAVTSRIVYMAVTFNACGTSKSYGGKGIQQQPPYNTASTAAP